jgi:prepilin-type N-terminal cleavage/methylation domain-containing protein
MKTISLRAGITRSRQRAYTLAEVVIAVAIISVMFISLYVGLAFGFAVTQLDRENLRATQIILERMEGIRLFTFDQVSQPALNPPMFTNYFYPLAQAGQSKGITYVGRVTVANGVPLSPPATYSDRLKTVTVTVTWTSGGLGRTRTMSTYVGRHGLQNYIYND